MTAILLIGDYRNLVALLQKIETGLYELDCWDRGRIAGVLEKSATELSVGYETAGLAVTAAIVGNRSPLPFAGLAEIMGKAASLECLSSLRQELHAAHLVG